MKNDYTKRIDRYLLGEMSTEEQQNFEQELANNADLKAEFELQKEINEAAQRASFRDSVKQAAKNYHLFQWLKWLGLSVLVIAALATTLMLFLSENKANTTVISEVENSENQPKIAPTLIENLPRQVFSWSGKDTLFVSENGVLVSVPAQALLKDGAPYTGAAIVEWQEAMDGASIMKAGLSTMADSNLLETQGMFSLRITDTEGNLLEVNPAVGVYVQAPVDAYKPRMQLYDGEYNQESIINWVNPVPLEKIPVPVPMSELDFYPAGYENTLNKLKLRQGKAFRDSLYLACEYENEPINEVVDEIEKEPMYLIDTLSYATVESIEDSCDDELVSVHPHIPPSNVLSFWNPTFDNTLLATREFERRMQTIHGICKEELLEKYMKNIDKPMWFTDSILLSRGYKQFEPYFAERVGGMDVDDAHLSELKAFYVSNTKSLREKMKALKEEYEKEGKQFSQKLAHERINQAIRTQEMNDKTIQEETQFNLKRKPQNNRMASTNNTSFNATELITVRQVTQSVGFRINQNNAIKNIDRKVADATLARRNIKGSYLGNKIDVRYNDFSISVQNAGAFSHLYVYLLPDKFNTYQRLTGRDGTFSYRLNDAVNYDVVVLGINDEGYFYHETPKIRKGNFKNIALQQVTEERFNRNINTLNKQRLGKPSLLQEEIAWLKLEKEHYKAQRQREEKRKFLERMRKVVFPCYENSLDEAIAIETPPTDSQVEVVEFPDQEAQFLGGGMSLRKYVSDNLVYPTEAIENNIQGKVFIEFEVDELGNAVNPKVISSPSETLNEVALKLVDGFPKYQPAVKNGRNVRSTLRIPINFELSE